KAETVAYHVQPDKSGLAFRLDKKLDYGAICFVLDCSGSMVDPANIFEGRTRFQHALKALEETLEQIPNDTFVSLIVFVQEKQEKAVRIRPFREATRWKGMDVDGAFLMAQLRNLEKVI